MVILVLDVQLPGETEISRKVTLRSEYLFAADLASLQKDRFWASSE
jgi:hypothetical protein